MLHFEGVVSCCLFSDSLRDVQHCLCICTCVVGATGPRIRELVETGGLEAEVSGSSYHWALLIAGSNTWWNYRHQADVCHAYQLLKKNGLPDERIIVMLYDDVASSMWNPYPEQLFNKPGELAQDD